MRSSSLICLCSLFAVATAAVLSVSGCSKPNQNTNEGEVLCPSGAYSATLFHRNADALRTATENISIIRYGEQPLNDIGNVYSASRETASGAQKLWLNWRNNDTLQIFRDPKTHSYKEEKHFDCLTGIFIQTTPFQIEYGDIKDIHPEDSKDTKAKAVPKKIHQK